MPTDRSRPGRAGMDRPSAERLAEAVAFSPDGLVAAVAQQHDSGEVLMLAWMSRESLIETLTSGRVTYFSRTRRALWRKGESSGHVQRLVECRLDCDGDAVLLLIDQTGPACHTNRRSCFYRQLGEHGLKTLSEPIA